MIIENQDLWDSYNGKGFSAKHADYSECASSDANGNDIVATYATKSELTGKVDKVEGKGLSENDYTDADKAKVGVIPVGATANSSLTCTGTDTYEWTGWSDTTVSVPKKKVEIGGRLYDYVQIGNQLWLAENLQFRWSGLSDTISSNTFDTTPWGVYYANNAELYGEYGLLYNGYALRYLAENASTLLPQGWRVPYNSHFTTLLDYLGGASIAGKKLKSTVYNGTDEYGFELMISGYCKGPGYSEPFNGFGTSMQLWSATTNGSTNQYAYSFYPSTDNVVQYNGEAVYGARYIRLVKTLA